MLAALFGPERAATEALPTVAGDSRLVDVRRRLAAARALEEAAAERVRRLSAILRPSRGGLTVETTEREFLEAKAQLGEAEQAWAAARLEALAIHDEETATLALVRREVTAAWQRVVRERLAAFLAALERLQADEHAALEAAVEQARAALGDQAFGAALVWPELAPTDPPHGTALAGFRRAQLVREGWLDGPPASGAGA